MGKALWLTILIRVLGIGGLVFNVASFQFNRHKKIVLFKGISEFLFAVQYIFLGAYTAAALDGVSTLRNCVFMKAVEKKKSTAPYIAIFVVVMIVLCALTWEGPTSVLALAAKVLTTVSYGMRKESKLRIIALPSSVAWVIYNAVFGAWEAAICDSLTVISLLIAICKFDLLPKMKK